MSKIFFKNVKIKQKKILVLGRAGIGKSTFCQYVTYRWAKGEIWTQYQLVIFIRLRFLTNDRYPPGYKYSPIDLVEREYYPCDTIPEEYKQHFKKQCDKGEVLWLLDGYDEFVQNIPEQLTDVFNYLRNKQHHIITSRPYSIALSYDVKIEIVGFTDDNIIKYIEQFFDQITDQQMNALSEGQKLIDFLKPNPSIWGISHIPVNLELICSLWADIDTSTANILNMTGLYDNITEWLCRRYLKKQNIDSVYMKKKTVYERCHKELTFLENLAFYGMEDNCIILRPNLFEKAETETKYSFEDHQQILNTGILHSLNDKPIGSRIQSQNDYYFIHLSFQEYFTARYLVNALNSSLCQKGIQFIKENKYNQRFALVFTFAFGLLNEKQYELTRNTFWNIISDEPLDLVGFRHIQLITYCIDESNDKSNIPQFANLLENVRQWMKYSMSVPDTVIYNQLIHLLQRSVSLLQEQIIIDQVKEFLQNSDSETKQNTCFLIQEASTYHSQSQFISSLITLLDDENEDIRYRACEALDEIGKKTATNELMSKLINALDDKRNYARSDACEVLGTIGEKAATNEVISKLVNALNDKDEYVRSNACYALSKIGEKANTNEVINKLINALDDQRGYVRSGACEALGDIGEKAGTNEVISKLMNALDDKDDTVKSNACEALGKIGKKAITVEMIEKLLEIIDSDDDSVKDTALEVLEKPFTVFEVLVKLNSDIVMKFLSCLNRNRSFKWETVPSDILIKVFLHTKDSVWLPVITLVTLLQESGVTITENAIVVHGSKEPALIQSSNQELTDQLVKAFFEQAVSLDLPCIRRLKIETPIAHNEVVSPILQVAETYEKPKKSSSMCIIL